VPPKGFRNCGGLPLARLGTTALSAVTFPLLIGVFALLALFTLPQTTRMRSGFPGASETRSRGISKPRSALQDRSAAIATSDRSASQGMDAPAHVKAGDRGARSQMNDRLGVVDPVLR
jgi:hypothetical protein